MVSKSDQKKSNDLVEQGKILFKNKEFVKAFQLLAEAIQLNPENIRAWSYLGKAEEGFGQYEDAINSYDKAIELDPNYASAWNNRGRAKNKLGKHLQAIKDYSKAIELDPKNPEAWNARGYAKNEVGLHSDAIEDITKSIWLDAKNADAWNNRGGVKLDIGQYEEAIEDINKAIELGPENASAWNNSGLAKVKLGQFADAIKDYDKAIKYGSKDTYIWNNRALAHSRSGNFDQAVEDAEKALKLDPSYEPARNNLAAFRAEKRALETIEERAGSLQQADESITDEIKKLDNDYKKLCKSRDMAVFYLLMIIVIMFGVVSNWQFILAWFCNGCICEIVDTCLMTPYPSTTDGGQFNFYSSLERTIITASLTVPILIRLKIKSRDAEETKILIHDYKRHERVQRDLNVYQPIFTEEKRQELHELLIKNMMVNSPVETLIKLKSKKSSHDGDHPLETIFKQCKEGLFNRKEKTKDEKPTDRDDN